MNHIDSTHIGSISVKPESSTSGDNSAMLSVSKVEQGDLNAIKETINSAFASDPIWTWAFPEAETRNHFLALYIEGLCRHPWAFKTSHCESAALWVPPGSSELSQEQEESLPSILKELLGPRADEVEDLFHRFDQAHPQTEPHYFLSLLGTHDDYRGRGIGMALLKENLARLDALQMPAYLESTNPANNKRYQSVGFEPISSFQAPANGPEVTCMWRENH